MQEISNTTMKRLIIIYTFLGVSLVASAQSDHRVLNGESPVRFVPGSAILATNPATGMSFQSTGSPFAKPVAGLCQQDEANSNDISGYNSDDDTLTHKKEKKAKGELHGSVGLSVIAGFGKGAPKGVGFAQNISLNYTMPIGKRGWLTAGGYMNHLNWSGMNTTSAGLYGELGYQINDNWSAFVYGQKSLANTGACGYGYPYYGYYGYGCDGFGYPGYNPYADRLGAAIRWAPNKNFSLQLSVEKDWMPKQGNGYYRKYDYQR